MIPYRGPIGPVCFVLISALITFVVAAPSVNVALKAAFNAPPYLVELLSVARTHARDIHELTNISETAAEENTTSYFPLLDRIAEGHFDAASTDRDLHDLFLRTLQDDGHITDPDTLSSFELALAVHSTAPRIEAHHQYYDTAVKTALEVGLGPDCDSWVDFGGKQYCSPELTGEDAKTIGSG